MTKKDEVILLKELKKSNTNALTELYKLMKDEVFRSAYSIVRDEDDAKDIRQEVFLKLWQNRDKEIRNLKAYLSKAARNIALNFVDKKKNEKLKQEEVIALQDSIQPPSEYEELRQYEAPSREKELMDAVAKLPKQQASVLTKVKLEGRTRQMVADSEQIQVATVNSHIQKALAQLRRWLKKKS